VCLLRCWLRKLTVRGIAATLEPSCNRPQDRQSEANPAKKGGCTPLLTTKYEPDITMGGVLPAKLQPASSVKNG